MAVFSDPAASASLAKFTCLRPSAAYPEDRHPFLSSQAATQERAECARLAWVLLKDQFSTSPHLANVPVCWRPIS